MGRIAKTLLAAAVLADCAMTAALFAKTFYATAEERLDEKVERVMAGMTRCEFGNEPAEDKQVPSDDEDERKDPIDEGFENIMRFSVNGKTGFEEQ